VLQRAGGDHNHDASNHRYHGSTATYYWRADHDNDARGQRRLLIAKPVAVASVTGRPSEAVFAFNSR